MFFNTKKYRKKLDEYHAGKDEGNKGIDMPNKKITPDRQDLQNS